MVSTDNNLYFGIRWLFFKDQHLHMVCIVMLWLLPIGFCPMVLPVCFSLLVSSSFQYRISALQTYMVGFLQP